MNKKIYILYHPGTYGSYLRWLVDFSNDIGHHHKYIPSSLDAKDGSAHYVDSLDKHINGEAIFETLSESLSNKQGYTIYRVLPIIYNESLTTDDVITKLIAGKKSCDKIIYIDTDSNFLKELMFINIELKTTYRETLNLTLASKLKNWDIQHTDFFKTDRWIQREILSSWFRGMINSLTAKPQRHTNVFYVDMYDILFGNTVNLAKQLQTYCELPFRENVTNHVSNIHAEFVSNQKSILYHKNMQEALHNCLNGITAPIGEMSLFAEAILQEQLLENGYSLQCYNLNELPKTTLELSNLLEKC
jgi:hypothetical protein